jgi:apolipoprotein N-acyltransferase
MIAFRGYLLALLSGVLLSMAWLGASGLVLLFAFVPLLLVEEHFYRLKKSNASIVFWPYAFVAVFVWNVLSTWWIAYASLWGALFVVTANSLLMSFGWWLFHAVRRSKGTLIGYAFLLFCFISIEFLQYNWDLSWPWLTLGNGLSKDLLFIQWYEFTGVLGGSWWILCANLLLSRIVIGFQFNGRNPNRWLLMAYAVVLLIPVLISLLIFQKYHEKQDEVGVALLQPNFDPYLEKYGSISASEQYDRLLNLADKAEFENIDFFIAPETALHEVWLENPVDNEIIPCIQLFLATKHPQAAFVTGAMTFKKYPSKQEATLTARPFSEGGEYYDAFNSALFIADNNVGVYHKSKLVSGVEKVPFQRYLGFLDALIVDLGGTTGSLGRSSETVVFEAGNSKIAVPICFESVYGEYCSQFVRKGANLLFVVSNDGWWRNSPGYKQHLSYAQALAVSLRRSVARVGNTGISCIINQRGQLEVQTQWWKSCSVSGNLNRNSRLTFYAKHGDYLGRISVLFLFLLVIYFTFLRVLHCHSSCN